MYLGDFLEDATVTFGFTTSDKSGGAVAPSNAFEAADLDWYKDNVAFAPAGVVMTSPLVSTGLHGVVVDTSDDGGDNWVTGSDYMAVLTPDETVDGETVIRVVAQFGIENRSPGDGTNLTEAGGDGGHLTESGGTGDQFTAITGDTGQIGALGVGLTAITDDTGQIGALGIGLTEAGGDGDHLVEAGGDGDQLTAINLPNQTMDIIGTITGNLAGDVTGNVDGTVTGKTPAEAGDSMALTGAAVDAILDEVIEGAVTLRQVISVALSILSGKSSGGGLVFRNEADDTDRVTIVADGSGNRTGSTLVFSDL
ncbi:MAG: hypothetical protein JRD68_00135 [Deltaproteobacteria bacterium]|nr:hypothetical protein [Deltaproteobacteria bacterium]